MDRRQEIERMIGQLQAIITPADSNYASSTAHAAADLLRTVGREHFAAQDDLRRYKEAAMSASGSFSMTGTPIGTRIGTNTGHGHVWKRPDGSKAKCGGPAICTECARDLASLRNVTPYVTDSPPDVLHHTPPGAEENARFLEACCPSHCGTCGFCEAAACVRGLNAERQNLRTQIETMTALGTGRENRLQAACASRDQALELLRAAHRELTPVIATSGKSTWQLINEFVREHGRT